MSKGILIGDKNDLPIHVRRDSNGMITDGMIVGERMIQDAYIVLKSNQGNIKEDPLCGANLLKMRRGKVSKEKIRKSIEISLKRVGIKISDVEQLITTMINGEKI